LRVVARAREEVKPPTEAPPVGLYTERQDTELALEQAAGRRALEKYAKRSETAAAAREKAKEDTTPVLSGFKIL